MFDDETLSLSIAVGTALLIITIIVGTVGGADRTANGDATLQVSGGWAAASLGAGNTSAGYLIIDNRTGRTDRLVAASAEGIATVELHMNIQEGGMVRMRPVDGIPLRNGKATALEPGGFHLMFMGLEEPLEAGETVDLTLKFQNAPPQTVTIPVRARRHDDTASGHAGEAKPEHAGPKDRDTQH